MVKRIPSNWSKVATLPGSHLPGSKRHCTTALRSSGEKRQGPSYDASAACPASAFTKPWGSFRVCFSAICPLGFGASSARPIRDAAASRSVAPARRKLSTSAQRRVCPGADPDGNHHGGYHNSAHEGRGLRSAREHLGGWVAAGELCPTAYSQQILMAQILPCFFRLARCQVRFVACLALSLSIRSRLV